MGIFFNDWLGSGNRKGKIPQHPGERYFTNQESYKEEVKVDDGYNGKKMIWRFKRRKGEVLGHEMKKKNYYGLPSFERPWLLYFDGAHDLLMGSKYTL